MQSFDPVAELLARTGPAKPGAKPFVTESESNIMFDVDDTLVLWREPLPDEETITFIDPFVGSSITLIPHKPHIKLLKNHFERGSKVYVWSAGGWKWAQAVVTALGLDSHVHHIMTKPRAFVDDLPAHEVLGEHIFMEPTHPWGNK
jgi:hypothetical protein